VSGDELYAVVFAEHTGVDGLLVLRTRPPVQVRCRICRARTGRGVRRRRRG